MRTILIAICLLLLLSSPVWAKIHTVRQDGFGDFTDIQPAIDAALVGDIVLVGDGTYTGALNRNLDPAGKAITIASQNGPASCVIDCTNTSSSRGFYVHSGEATTTVIRGFTIRNARASGIQIANASPTIRNNIIEDCDAAFGNGGGGIYAENSTSLIARNTIRQNVAPEGEDGGGLFLHAFGGTLVNNVIAQNFTGAGGRGGGIYLESGSVASVINNLLFANDAGGAGGRGGGIFVNGGSLTVRNCTFIRNECYEFTGGGGLETSGASASIRNSIFWNNYPNQQLVGGGLSVNFTCILGGWGGGTGNISTNPQLVNGSAGDAHLGGSSPCIDSGGDAASSVCFAVVESGLTVCLDQYTTRTSEADDTGTVDMGFHYGHANPRYVPDDFATIQAALDQAVPGDDIVVRAGTWGQVEFRGLPVTVRSEDGPAATSISTGPPERNVTINSGESTDAVLSGFEIKNADFVNYGAGILCDGTDPTLTDLIIRGNAASRGGGLACRNGADAYVRSSVMFYNAALNEGAGVYCDGGSDPLLANVTLYLNTASGNGSGVAALGDSHPVLVNCIFNAHGGTSLTYCADTSDITCRCCDVYGNAGGDWAGCLAGQNGIDGNFSAPPLFCDSAAADFGLHDNSPCAAANNPGCGLVGALPAGGCGAYFPLVCPDGSGDYTTIQAAINASSNGDVIELCDGVFSGPGNRNISYGGRAITVRSRSGNPELTIVDCEGTVGEERRGFLFMSGESASSVLEGVTVRNALAWHAAGLFCESGASPTISNCIFEHNTANSRGGGMSAHNGSAPTVSDCVFRYNTATTDGGGLRLFDGAPLVQRCTFYGNNALGLGGAVYMNGASSPQFQDCLVYDNTSSAGAGGLHVDIGSDLTAENCTIHGNTGVNASNVLAENNSSAVLGQCIVTAGIGATGAACGAGSTITLTCSDVYGNAGGDWVGCLAGQLGIAGNVSADPRYCDAAGFDFTVAADSPCAAGVSGCGQMGAFGVGCGTATITVQPDGSGDYATIQAAIDAVPSGGVIQLGDGTYTGTGNRDLDDRDKTFTLRSLSDDPAACVIDCQGTESVPHRGIVIDSGQGPGMVLRGITITNGWRNYGGGMQINGASNPTVENCIFSNSISTDGGGVFVTGGSSPVINDCLFDGNSVTNAGGGLRFSISTGEVNGCEFRGNYGYWGGGGVYLYQSAPTVDDCLFVDNSCFAWGADLTIHRPESNTTVSGCTFVGGTSPDSSVRIRGGATPVLENCLIAFSTQGSAVSCEDFTSATLICCDVYGNQGGDWVGCIAGQAGASDNTSTDPMFCDAAADDFMLAAGSPCLAANNPACGRIGARGQGCSSPSAVDDDPDLPLLTRLHGCYPNPFNPQTTIAFALAKPGPVTVAIYELRGRNVCVLAERAFVAGEHELVWTGRDAEGRSLPSGSYLVRLVTDTGVWTRKMMLLR